LGAADLPYGQVKRYLFSKDYLTMVCPSAKCRIYYTGRKSHKIHLTVQARNRYRVKSHVPSAPFCVFIYICTVYVSYAVLSLSVSVATQVVGVGLALTLLHLSSN